MRATVARIVISTLLGPAALLVAVATFGAGNPIGILMGIAPLYLIGALVLDVWNLVKRRYLGSRWYWVAVVASGFVVAEQAAWMLGIGRS